MQPINIFNSQDVKVTIDENGTPVDVYISGGTATELQFYSTFSALPSPGQGGILYVTEDTNYLYRWDGAYIQVGGGSLTWGQITGTLSDQTDLQDALDDKVPYTGATGNIDIGNNQLISDDGTNDSVIGPNYVASENASGYAVIEPTGLYVGDISGQMEVNSSGLVFPDDSIQTTAGISGVDWGDIQGTLSNQTDLQDALDDKVPYTGANENINLGNHSIVMDDGVTDSEISPSLVAVENHAGTEYGLLEYNQLSIVDNVTPSIMTVTSAGLTFPDSTTQTTAAAAQSLQDVTDVGNTTTNDIQLINDADVILGAGGKVLMDNGSKLQEGTTDAGNGGSKGIALKCSADYELKWEAGRLYTMEQNGFTIREVSHNFTFTPSVTDDDAKGFVIGSRWILDNGDIYTCTDATNGAAVWSLESLPSGTVTSVDTAGLISGGPITTSGTITTSMANNKLVGRYSSGSGIMEEITIGDGLTLTGAGRLNNTATPTELGYYGGWQDNITQTAAASNTGYAMIFRVVDLENQVRVVTNGTNLTRITFDNTGIYNLQFSSQFQNISNQLADVTIWLRLNGTDVAGSAGFISIPNSHGGTPGHSIASWNYLLSVIAGEYYEIVWSTTNHTDVTMEFYSAGSPPPSCASVIATVTQQSGIMAGTGITALNSLTGSVQTLVTGTSGSDFGISSSGTIHTFNLPTASATKRGALSSTDWSTFNGKQNALTNPITGTGTNNEIAYFNTTGSTIGSLSTATYPSLTELSYIKGVTSAIQTQLNGKQATLTNPITGTGTSGQVAYWNGTSTQTGSATLTYTPTTSLLVNNSVTASGAIARGTNLTPTLVAAANSDVLVGLDIAPTFTNGAFTNVTNRHLRVQGTSEFTGAIYQSGDIYNRIGNNGVITISGGSSFNVGSNIRMFPSTHASTPNILQIFNASTQAATIFSNGNFLIQTGGTHTDSGYKLDVNGTARVSGAFLSTGVTTGSGSNSYTGIAATASGATATLGYGGVGASGGTTFDIFQNGTAAIGIAQGRNVAIGGGGNTANDVAMLYVTSTPQFSSATTRRGVYFNNTLVAAANNNILIGLDISPTFTNGAFTGVSNYALRTVTGDIYFASTSGTVGIGTAPTSTYKLDVNGTARVQGDFTLSDSKNLILGTTTGTKIGTATSQKIGFWNATPIVQPTTAVTASTLVSNLGTTLTDTDTFDGYTLKQIVKALRNTGILA